MKLPKPVWVRSDYTPPPSTRRGSLLDRRTRLLIIIIITVVWMMGHGLSEAGALGLVAACGLLTTELALKWWGASSGETI